MQSQESTLPTVDHETHTFFQEKNMGYLAHITGRHMPLSSDNLRRSELLSM